MAKKKKMNVPKQIVKQSYGSLKVMLNIELVEAWRIEMYCYFEERLKLLNKKPVTASSIQTILNVGTLSAVYQKVQSNRKSITITRTEACASIMALVESENPILIELKAALLKAL